MSYSLEDFATASGHTQDLLDRINCFFGGIERDDCRAALATYQLIEDLIPQLGPILIAYRGALIDPKSATTDNPTHWGLVHTNVHELILASGYELREQVFNAAYESEVRAHKSAGIVFSSFGVGDSHFSCDRIDAQAFSDRWDSVKAGVSSMAKLDYQPLSAAIEKERIRVMLGDGSSVSVEQNEAASRQNKKLACPFYHHPQESIPEKFGTGIGEGWRANGPLVGSQEELAHAVGEHLAVAPRPEHLQQMAEFETVFVKQYTRQKCEAYACAADGMTGHNRMHRAAHRLSEYRSGKAERARHRNQSSARRNSAKSQHGKSANVSKSRRKSGTK